MSWAFLADLDVTLPAQAWTRIQAKRPRDISLAKGWSGLEEATLEDAFGRPLRSAETFAQVIAWDWGKDAIVVDEVTGDGARVRVCAALDKSLLDMAFPLAALLEAARSEGGAGSLRLVNDGTSGAEAGSEMILAGGRIEATPLDDFEELLEELAGEMLQHRMRSGGKPMINPFTGKAIVVKERINPFTGKPFEAPNAKKAPAKKATKAAPAKRPPTKDPPTKKPPAKKPPTKKATKK